MHRRTLLAVALVALAAPLTAFSAGGWAVVTLEKTPTYFVAGTAMEMPFTVKQHGVTLLDGLSPSLVATSGETEVKAAAKPAGAKGRYTVSFTAPRPGMWSVRIISGFRTSELRLPPIRAIAPGTPAPVAEAKR